MKYHVIGCRFGHESGSGNFTFVCPLYRQVKSNQDEIPSYFYINIHCSLEPSSHTLQNPSNFALKHLVSAVVRHLPRSEDLLFTFSLFLEDLLFTFCIISGRLRHRKLVFRLPLGCPRHHFQTYRPIDLMRS